MKIMIVVSTRMFREKQGEYLGMAKNGEDIVVKSRGNGSFKIVPVTEDDTLMSKEDFFKKLDRSIQQIADGKVIEKRKGQSMKDFLKEL
jgi:antitoxin (DNA-binding transcriptional repressor) of toxin-antitoxin stability system